MAIFFGSILSAWMTLVTGGSLDEAIAAATIAVLLGLAAFDDGAGVEWASVVCGQDAPQDHAEPFGQGKRGES